VLANIDSVMEEVVAELDGKKQSKANGHGGDKDELPPKLASMLCVEGSGGYPSRSELLFAFLAEALRKKIKAEAIADACVDEKYRGFGIFEHCRENDEGREYVLRQIEHALEKVVPAEDSDDPLNEMNERFAVVMIGGKARVLTWEASPFDQCWKIPVYLPRNDFRFLQDKWRVIYVDAEGETQKVPRGSWWLSHPARRQYDSVVFVPGKDVPGKLNLWNGWACEPRPGDCGLYLAHLKDNICSGDDSYYQYLLSWMAYAVQQPARQGEVAVVLRGGEGTGKGFAVKRFGRLFGPHFLPVTNTRHLTGNFNVHLQQCCVLFGDEAFYAGDRQHEGILKVLVTEESLTIEPKGVDIFLVPNYLHVVLSSNNEWVVPASFDARRWFVLDVSDAQKQNTDYFGKIDDQMFAGGQEALLHLLMTRDISKFDVRNVPKTEALAKQKEMTRRGLDRVVEKVAHDGVLPCTHREYFDVAMTSGEGDGQGFYTAARRIAPDLKYVSSITMARTLKEEWECGSWKSNGLRGIRFPELGKLRELFDKKFGAQTWDEETTDWERYDWGEDVGEDAF
jgi:Family of unknown function (DUF5906)